MSNWSWPWQQVTDHTLCDTLAHEAPLDSILTMGNELRIPIPIRFTGLLCFLYGLQIFRCGNKCRIMCNILSKFYYLLLIIGVAPAVKLVFHSDGSRIECGIVMMIFMMDAVAVYVFLRRNITKIERVLTGVSCYLTIKNMDKIKWTDRVIIMLHFAADILSASLAIPYFDHHKKAIKHQFEEAGLTDVTDTMVLMITIFAYVYHMKVLYGIIVCSIQLYTITMVVFNCMTENLMILIKQSLIDGK